MAGGLVAAPTTLNISEETRWLMRGYRPTDVIERELHDARQALCGNLPTHERVNRCERLYAELQEAKRLSKA